VKLALPPSLLAINPHLAATRAKPRRAPAVVTYAVTHAGGAVVCALDGLRLDVTPNSRGHWATKARRVARQRAMVDAALAGVTPPRGARYVVTITRRSPGTLDGDNAVASAKGPRDSVAAWLGIDDGSDRVAWTVTQERAPWGVVIRVESVTESAVCT